MKKKLRKTNELRDTTPPNSSRQYVGPLRGCVKTHHSKLATRCNLCKHNKTKLVKLPRAKTPAPVEEVQTANSKMICQRCPQLRQELQRTRDNVLLIEGLLEEAKRREKTQETLDRLSMLHKHCRKNYDDMANITFALNHCQNLPRCPDQ
mgnify:FL=1